MADQTQNERPFIESLPLTKPEQNTPPAPDHERADLGMEKAGQTETGADEAEATVSKTISGISFPGFKKSTAIPQYKDATAIKIEKIMEEDLKDIYQTLPPIVKQEFKLKGESAAAKIRELLKSTHIRAKKIFALIVEWLKILPGINHFFLEQEAKIKTDKMLLLKKN